MNKPKAQSPKPKALSLLPTERMARRQRELNASVDALTKKPKLWMRGTFPQGTVLMTLLAAALYVGVGALAALQIDGSPLSQTEAPHERLDRSMSTRSAVSDPKAGMHATPPRQALPEATDRRNRTGDFLTTNEHQ